MFIVKNTSNSIESVHALLEQTIATHGFSLLYFYDFHALLDEKGFPIERKAFTYEICRASMASKILTYHPIFSAMMPCRISTFEQEGKTCLATIDMVPLLESLNNNEELYNEAHTLFNQLLEFMEALTQ